MHCSFPNTMIAAAKWMADEEKEPGLAHGSTSSSVTSSSSKSPVTQLCQPLVSYLYGPRPPLDDTAKNALREVEAAIEAALTCSTTTLLGSSITPVPIATTNSITASSRTAVSVRLQSAEQSSLSDPPSLCDTPSYGFRAGVVKVKQCKGQEHGRSEHGPEQKTRSKQERLLPHKALFPTYPYTELSVEESNDTVMHKLLGRRACEWWRRHNRKNFIKGLWITSVFAWLSGFYLGFGPLQVLGEDTVDALGGALVAVFVLVVLWLWLSVISLMNWAMVKRCAAVYDTHFLMAEMFFFSCSYFILLEHSVPSALTACGVFGGFCCIFLLYDSFGVADRPRLRYVQLFHMTAFAIFLVLIYTEAGTRVRPYRLEVASGFKLVEERSRKSCDRSSSDGDPELLVADKLSLSLKDFCLNRGCTVLVLMMKLVYSSFRHPDDLLIIKSRVRSTDIIHSPPGASAEASYGRK